MTSLFDRWKKTRRQGAAPPSGASPRVSDRSAPVTRPAVVERLRAVIDPEVNLNIVDLGLIYDLRVAPPTVALTLTMTTAACPLSGYIVQQARSVLEALPGVERVEVDLAWQPAWSPQMIDAAVRANRFGSRR